MVQPSGQTIAAQLVIRSNIEEDILVKRTLDASTCNLRIWHLRQVQVDLIAIEVGIEGGAVGVVHADRALALHSRQANDKSRLFTCADSMTLTCLSMIVKWSPVERTN